MQSPKMQPNSSYAGHCAATDILTMRRIWLTQLVVQYSGSTLAFFIRLVLKFRSGTHPSCYRPNGRTIFQSGAVESLKFADPARRFRIDVRNGPRRLRCTVNRSSKSCLEILTIPLRIQSAGGISSGMQWRSLPPRWPLQPLPRRRLLLRPPLRPSGSSR